MMKKVLETERLILREFSQRDADFVFRLLNSPNWLEFIGDKGIQTINDATNYIVHNLMKSYEINGYGLWLVVLKETNTSIGMCGIVNREILNHPDIGFAFLPEYENCGYGLESANAVKNYAKYTLNLNLVAITDANNNASIKLLERIGFRFEEIKEVAKHDNVLVFSSEVKKTAIEIIDELTTIFFNVFTNTNNLKPNLDDLREILLPEAIIINNTNSTIETYGVEEFIAPRKKLLNGGALLDFTEYEISNHTEVFNTIASRFCLYKKEGKLNGNPFETIGQKIFQFVKVNNEWKISSVAWCDYLE